MFNKFLISALTLVICFAANAVTVAIVDSGVDYKHEALDGKMWTNPIEFPLGFNNRDDDKNGYQDDIYGWNFVGQDSKVIDYKYLGTFSDDPKKFYEIQLKRLNGEETANDKKWVQDKLKDEDFIKEITKFSNFIHGTHVSGITTSVEEDAKIMAIRMIPVEIELPIPGVSSHDSLLAQVPFLAAADEESEGPPLAGMDRDLVDIILKKGLGVLAGQQVELLAEIAAYADSHQVDVLNGSFGTGGEQAITLVGTFYKLLTGKDPEPEKLIELTLHFMNSLIEKGKKIADSASDTLFVFASGNDGMNNDILPSSPANIKADNVISVGASMEFDSLAEFSNFGKKTVHVLAPGVGIRSSIPGNEYISASGTSQAAPYVAGVAAAVKKINPSLKPVEIKQILIDTVDKKEMAADVTVSGGVVNVERAKAAARLSKSISVNAAIVRAKRTVDNMEARFSLLRRSARASFDRSMTMPMPSSFKLSRKIERNAFKINKKMQKAMQRMRVHSTSVQ